MKKRVFEDDISSYKDFNKQYIYAQLMGVQKRLFSTDIEVQLDYGQERTFFTQRNKLALADADGEMKTFNSMMDALSYMSSLGWEFVQAYAFAVGSQNVYHYLLRKEVIRELEEKDNFE